MNSQKPRTVADILILLLLPAPLTGIVLILLSVYVLADQPVINLNLDSGGDAAGVSVVQPTRTLSAEAALIATVSSAPQRQYIPPDVSGGESAEVAAALGYSEALIQSGQRNYLSICAACHNTDARGISGSGKTLIDSEYINTRSDEELLQFVIEGRAIWDPLNTTGVAMPARGGNPGLTDSDILSIIAYIRILNGDVVPPSGGSETLAAAPDTGSTAGDDTTSPSEGFTALTPGSITGSDAGDDTTSPSEGFTALTPGMVTGSDSDEPQLTASEEWAYPDVSALLASLGVQLEYADPQPERTGEAAFAELCGLRYAADFDLAVEANVCDYLVDGVQSGTLDADTLTTLLTLGNPLWNNDDVPVHIHPRLVYPPLSDGEIQNLIDYLIAEFAS